MRLLSVAAAIVLILPAGTSHAGLTGADRSNFLAMYRRNCARSIRDDERLVGVPDRTVLTICSCAGARMADRVDYSQLWTIYHGPVSGAPQSAVESPEMQEVEMEALSHCINHHQGGYMPGMTVVPNK